MKVAVLTTKALAIGLYGRGVILRENLWFSYISLNKERLSR
jgi:hypothetical protein